MTVNITNVNSVWLKEKQSMWALHKTRLNSAHLTLVVLAENKQKEKFQKTKQERLSECGKD